jgi:hypothetical protein
MTLKQNQIALMKSIPEMEMLESTANISCTFTY